MSYEENQNRLLRRLEDGESNSSGDSDIGSEADNISQSRKWSWTVDKWGQSRAR